MHLEPINSLAISHKLFDPADGHPVISQHRPQFLVQSAKISHAPLRIREILMVAHKMLLIKRILLNPLIVLETLKDDLAEAVEIGDVTHLGVEELAHQCSCGGLVVDLLRLPT